jgi:hypothetical protein
MEIVQTQKKIKEFGEEPHVFVVPEEKDVVVKIIIGTYPDDWFTWESTFEYRLQDRDKFAKDFLEYYPDGLVDLEFV